MSGGRTSIRDGVRALAAVGVLAIASGAGAAETAPAGADASPEAASAFVQLFVTLCVANAGHLDRVEVVAATMGLKAITSLEGTSVAQAAPDVRTRAWRVAGAAGVPFALSASEGRQRGKTVTVCALTDPTAPAQPVEQAFAARFHLDRPFRREPDADESRTYWDVTVDGQKMVLSTTDATPIGRAGISLAATVTRR